MALADTARLIAALELQDKFSATAAKYEKTLGSMERKTSTLEKVGFQIGRGARSAVDNLGRIGVIAGGVIASQVALGVKSLAQLEEVKNQTDAVLQSTKGVAFTNVRNEVGEGNDIFSQATETLLDMSVALGTEPKQAAIQLGKALNDPIRGITALRRVGVSFTEQQEKQIEKMVESGRTLDAQRVIIQELNKEFGGSAKAGKVRAPPCAASGMRSRVRSRHSLPGSCRSWRRSAIWSRPHSRIQRSSPTSRPSAKGWRVVSRI
jgi:hypothetical protein